MSEHVKLTAAQVRVVIWDRQGGTCAACGMGMLAEQMHAHHRMRRRDLGWCPCNVIGLHPSCHVIAPEAVHQRPAWAREHGLIVPTWGDPRQTPVLLSYPWRAWCLLSCDGLVSSAPQGTPLPSGEVAP